RRWTTIDVGYLVGPGTTVSLGLTTTAARPVLLASRESGATASKLLVEPPAGATNPLAPVGPPVAPPPGAGPGPPSPGGPSSITPCGVTGAPPAWQHVVWIVMENKSYEHIIGAPDAPFANALAARCG